MVVGVFVSKIYAMKLFFKGSSTCTLEIYFQIVWGDFVIHMCSIIFRFDMDLGLEKIYWREKNRRKNEI